MKDIIAGLILIGIGFAFGGSIFLGDVSAPSLIFDGLGIFWIIKGAVKIAKSRQQA
ncbi:MAG: hypothetical protein ACREN5_09650 [Gemmatimonadales bacterium]